MASKKGCMFGCLGLLVVGGGLVLAVGLAGGGAWFWMGGDSSMFDFGGDGPSADFLEMIEVPMPDLPEPPDAHDDGVASADPALELGADVDAARSALEEALAMEALPPEPAPAAADAPADEVADPPPSSGSGGSSASGGSGGSSSSEPAPQPKPKPAPSTGGGGGNNVTVTGDATVVLVSGGARYNMPGRVPAGTYDIEAAFSGEAGVVVGTIKVSGGSYAIHCSGRMGTCRVR